MRPLRISEDVVPIGRFKGQAARWLRKAEQSGHPIVITRNGEPAGVLVSPAEYDRLAERERLLESVAAGIADADAGRVMETDELRRQLAIRRRKLTRR